MKKTPSPTRKSSLPTNGNTGQKRRRRHTRMHLESLRPLPLLVKAESCFQCPKCQGLLSKDYQGLTLETVDRCLNCGWLSQHTAPIISETEEARNLRALVNQFGLELIQTE